VPKVLQGGKILKKVRVVYGFQLCFAKFLVFSTFKTNYALGNFWTLLCF
jgi:hypothetical protein